MLVGLLEEAQEEEQLHADTDVEHRADRLVTLLAGIGLLAGVERPGAGARAGGADAGRGARPAG